MTDMEKKSYLWLKLSESYEWKADNAHVPHTISKTDHNTNLAFH